MEKNQAACLESILKLTAAQNILLKVSDQAPSVSDNLAQYDAVIFLGRFGDAFTKLQQVDFEKYMQAGGGFMGIQAELTQPQTWPWYTAMYQALSGKNNIIKVNQAPHRPEKEEAANLPFNQEYEGGRVSLLGGRSGLSFQDPGFADTFLSGLAYAIGATGALQNGPGGGADTEKRFHRRVLQKELHEGVKLTIAGNGDLYYIERGGKVFKHEPEPQPTGTNKEIGTIAVSAVSGNGLLGIVLDPEFSRNNLIYLYYTPQKVRSLHQKVSRFRLNAQGLDMASEKVMLTIPYDFPDDAHTGGALLFDDKGNLFISTGDNTQPHEAKGFGPMDDRPGRTIFDAQRTAGNTGNLLGKILRIRPQADGTYTIPEGNLFPGKNGKDRPEIFVMGCRNPYTLSFDSRTGYLYWGEIGPDAGRDSTRGPRGYDEINRTRKGGFFGWPYFTGENKAYAAYDFGTGKLGAFYDPAAPVNNSANNTGSKLLPPAQLPLIAYPYAKSEKYPELGEGTRCAIVGPVYHYDPDLKSATKFPKEYDNVLFIADWSREWIRAVYLDEAGNYSRSEPFMPLTTFDRPMDLKFGPDGALYLLEYGEPWGIFKNYGSLVRIEHNSDNRPPLAVASSSDTVGAEPLAIKFSAQGSKDYDGDPVTLKWTINGKTQASKEGRLEHTFRQPGQYVAMLTVTDSHGMSSQDWIHVKVGNSKPKVSIETTANQTFYWDNSLFEYAVKVADKEDGPVNRAHIQVSLDYLPEGKDVAGLFIGSQQIQQLRSGNGSVLMAKSDCKTCHTLDKPSLGPALQQIAHRYTDNNATVEMLAKKVIAGGGGMWGHFAMSAHPQVSRQDASAMVRYILSLDKQADGAAGLPAQGRLVMKQHTGMGNEGLYIFTASYTDKGNNRMGPLSAGKQLRLRHPRVDAASFDTFKGVTKIAAGQGTSQVGHISPGDYISFKDLDLRHVDHLTYNLVPGTEVGSIEVRVGSPQGPVISHVDILPAGGKQGKRRLAVPIKDPGGKNELFFVFGGGPKKKQDSLRLDWISFDPKQDIAKAGKTIGRARS